MPNVGLFVGFNLPVYHKKLAAGVCEAQARAAADAKLYEAERDQTNRDIKDLLRRRPGSSRMSSTCSGRTTSPPPSRCFDLTASDYRASDAGVDYLSLVSAWREVLQVELQIAQVEAELGKTLASLERAVGAQINEHPPDPGTVGETGKPAASTGKLPSEQPAPPPPTGASSPFRSEDR